MKNIEYNFFWGAELAIDYKESKFGQNPWFFLGFLSKWVKKKKSTKSGRINVHDDEVFALDMVYDDEWEGKNDLFLPLLTVFFIYLISPIKSKFLWRWMDILISFVDILACD